MGLSGRTIALLAVGMIGWLILFIALAGGFKRTVTKTVASPPVTVTVTRTVVKKVPTPATTPAQTSPGTTTASPRRKSASLAVLTAGGKADPVADVGRVFEFYLYSPSETTLFVKYRSAGGAPCAATEDSDSGTELVGDVNIITGKSHYRTAQTWQETGRFLFCMWLGSSSDDPQSRVFSQTISFRAPRGHVGFKASPSYATVNQPVSLTFYGSSEAPRALFVKYRSAGGAACAPTAGTDSGFDLISGDSVNGGFNEKVVWTPSSAGAYMLCVWIANDSGDASPVAQSRFYLTVR